MDVLIDVVVIFGAGLGEFEFLGQHDKMRVDCMGFEVGYDECFVFVGGCYDIFL